MNSTDDKYWADYQTAGFSYSPRSGVHHYIEPDPSGQTTGVFPFAQPAGFVTAHNPGGPPIAKEVNDARHRELEAAVAALGHKFFLAQGGRHGRAHQETGLLILDVSPQFVNEMGVRFGQAAIYIWSATEFLLEACGGRDERKRSCSQGWKVNHISEK